MEEVPRIINLSSPASIPLSCTRSYYAGVAEPLKSVYGMICSTDCASVEQYLALSKENQLRVKAYVPVDLTIAKFKVDTNRSRRDEYGRSQQKLSNAKEHLRHWSLTPTIDHTDDFINKFHDLTERTLQEEIKNVINQMIRFSFNEYLSKSTPLLQHDGVRIMSYNDVVAYVGNQEMPADLPQSIRAVWENLYKRGHQRRSLTQSVLDLFNLRLIPNNASNGRGHILDHNFICYYVNEVLNNLKGPILKKNRNENFRSVDVSTKRKMNSIGHLKEPPGNKTPYMRGNHPQHPFPAVVATTAGIQQHPAPQVVGTASIPSALQSFPGVVLGPQNINIPPVVNPQQQMMNFMSMFFPHLQQQWTTPPTTSATSAVNHLSANPPASPPSSFIPHPHKSQVCLGRDGKQLTLDQHALLNEALPNEDPLSLSSSSDDDDDDDLDVAVPNQRVHHPLRVRTSRTSPFGRNRPGTPNQQWECLLPTFWHQWVGSAFIHSYHRH
jgi:hypothetical protein